MFAVLSPPLPAQPQFYSPSPPRDRGGRKRLSQVPSPRILFQAQTAPSPAEPRGEPAGSRDLARPLCLAESRALETSSYRIGCLSTSPEAEQEPVFRSVGASISTLYVPGWLWWWGSGRTAFSDTHCCARESSEGFAYVLCLCSCLGRDGVIVQYCPGGI